MYALPGFGYFILSDFFFCFVTKIILNVNESLIEWMSLSSVVNDLCCGHLRGVYFSLLYGLSPGDISLKDGYNGA